jgi:phage FluMu protein Com
MPIRFRCSYCNRLLGIATRKAGTETTCPHCGYSITVPVPEEQNERTERMSLDDVEAALGRGATEMAPPAAVAPPPVDKPRADAPKPAAKPKLPASPPPPAKPAAKPLPSDPNDRPLFEGNMDDILGKTKAPVEPEERKKKPKPVSGADALSVTEPAQNIVISPQKATLLMVAVVVLVVLAFVAGYLING